jgi:hypothetical protein
MFTQLNKNKSKLFLLAAFVLTMMSSPTLTLAKSKLSRKKKESVAARKLASLSNAIYTIGYKDRAQGQIIAQLILDESIKSSLDPNLLAAMIMVESTFDQNSVSSSGDLSIAQINLPIWNAEFKRLNRELIDPMKIKTDIPYSIHRMAEILTILADRRHNEGDWYGDYHSKTPKRKIPYVKRVKEVLHQINNNFNYKES